MRKVFTVLIHNKEYDVYSIENKEHGGYNGEVKTWWLYYNTRLPEGLLPSPDSEYFVPWSNSINRRLWEVKFRQTNTSKHKWDEWRFSNTTVVEMWCNNKLVYSFNTTGNDSGMSFAFGKVEYLKTVLSEHPYNFFEPETEEGRKIWWKGLPATIKNSSSAGEIRILPDYTTGLSKRDWWSELKRRQEKLTYKPDNFTDETFEQLNEEHFEESMYEDSINWGDALEDKHIDWFRN